MCTISVYFAENESALYVRNLQLTGELTATDFEAIANAVSSLIEETAFNLTENRTDTPRPPVSDTRHPVHRNQSRMNPNVELHLLYRGQLFAESKVTHGIEMGLCILLNRWLQAGLGNTQGFAARWQRETYRFSIVSRFIEANIGGRFYLEPTRIELFEVFKISVLKGIP